MPQSVQFELIFRRSKVSQSFIGQIGRCGHFKSLLRLFLAIIFHWAQNEVLEGAKKLNFVQYNIVHQKTYFRAQISSF